MFTGLVEATGKLRGREERGPGYELSIATMLGPLDVGESIAVNGACLTVTRTQSGLFVADISRETSDKTTLGRVPLGSSVNLERSLRFGDRLGGHLVSGHVDGLARVSSCIVVGNALDVTIAFPPELAEYIAPKGSVVLDGVSLTVNRVSGNELSVMLIPHTLEVTNLKALAPETLLNLEVDLLARYVVNSLRVQRSERDHA
jgi:riboflavin synthase